MKRDIKLTTDWREEYKRKLTSPEEAVKVVKSGERVVIPSGREPEALGLALAARRDELRNVEILVGTIGRDFGWYDPGWEDSFRIQTRYVFPRGVGRAWMDERRGDYVPNLTGLLLRGERERPTEVRLPDVVLVEVSAPDEQGFCSFGASMWDKKEQILLAKKVIAQVNSNLIRTYGDNFVHVSQIDFFTEYTPKDKGWHRGWPELSDTVKTIAGYISELVKGRDTIQVGLGNTTWPLVEAGAFDDKHDLGLHMESLPPFTSRLIKRGIATGNFKTLHPGKAVATACGGHREDMEFYNENPLIELYGSSYVNNIKVIAAHDNMVAINNALAVDLTGQIASESLGTRIYGGAGGQTEFAIGAIHSRGGRSIFVLPATAEHGTISRIVPTLSVGTAVTVPRSFVDYVVTEFGIAKLFGKSQRQRAQELIAVAHPNFRPELEKEARGLYWP